MTLQNLSKILDKYESQLGSSNTEQFEVLKGLPFYHWESDRIISTKQAQQIDFNHAIGLPEKGGVPYPLHDYERLLYDTLQSNKHVWCKKATGLGVTEFMLRYMAWLCFRRPPAHLNNQDFRDAGVVSGSQMCIVTGPRIELAITLIDRMKGLSFEYRSDSS